MTENKLDVSTHPSEESGDVSKSNPLLLETQQERDAKRTFQPSSVNRQGETEETVWRDPKTGAQFVEITDAGKLAMKRWDWPDGSSKTEYAGNMGCSVQANPRTGVQATAHCWGPAAESNYEETDWNSGEKIIQFNGGTGFSTHQLAGGGLSYHNWGPRNSDNYDVTVWDENAASYQYSGGDGFSIVKKEDGSTFEHHWGPDKSNNYDRTTWMNGTQRVQYSDGTGLVFSDENGAKLMHSWGPKASDNVDQWQKDGIEFVQKADGSGYVGWQLPDGWRDLHSWPPAKK